MSTMALGNAARNAECQSRKVIVVAEVQKMHACAPIMQANHMTSRASAARAVRPHTSVRTPLLAARHADLITKRAPPLTGVSVFVALKNFFT
jgi:hypothetical protein